MKLCLIYNFAQHYRTSIFKLLSEEFDCDFLFGDSMGDIKKMDYSLLKGNIMETRTKRLLGGWYYQPKVISQLFKGYDSYILLGETRAVSTWLFCIFARLLKPRKKVYLWSHAWYGKESRLEKIIKKVFFHLPNGGLFVYGNYARRLMIKEGFNSDKLFIIHNSLAYDKQIELRKQLAKTSIYSSHFGNENYNLFFVGRITPVKKLDQILDAMALSKKHGISYNMTFIGDGTERKFLELKVKSLNLYNQVWFYGSCYDEKELSNLIYNADLCVAPGNIGLSAMHSLVFGTPAITHSDFAYQMPEFEAIRDGKTGTYFEKDNIESLSNNIDAWFRSKGNQRDTIRKECFKEIDEQWNPYFQIKVLKEALNK